MDPRIGAMSRTVAQEQTRKVVGRVVEDNLHALKHGGSLTPVEEAFVKAVYAPDKRLG
jgi:hypothetical protein